MANPQNWQQWLKYLFLGDVDGFGMSALLRFLDKEKESTFSEEFSILRYITFRWPSRVQPFIWALFVLDDLSEADPSKRTVLLALRIAGLIQMITAVVLYEKARRFMLQFSNEALVGGCVTIFVLLQSMRMVFWEAKAYTTPFSIMFVIWGEHLLLGLPVFWSLLCIVTTQVIGVVVCSNIIYPNLLGSVALAISLLGTQVTGLIFAFNYQTSMRHLFVMQRELFDIVKKYKYKKKAGSRAGSNHWRQLVETKLVEQSAHEEEEDEPPSEQEDEEDGEGGGDSRPLPPNPNALVTPHEHSLEIPVTRVNVIRATPTPSTDGTEFPDVTASANTPSPDLLLPATGVAALETSACSEASSASTPHSAWEEDDEDFQPWTIQALLEIEKNGEVQHGVVGLLKRMQTQDRFALLRAESSNKLLSINHGAPTAGTKRAPPPAEEEAAEAEDTEAGDVRLYHRFTLAFIDRALEHTFMSQLTLYASFKVRVIALCTLLVEAAFGVQDWLYLPAELLSSFFIVRYAIIIPSILLFLAFTMTPFNRSSITQYAICALLLVVGLCNITMNRITHELPEDNVAKSVYLSSWLRFLMHCSTSFMLRFINSIVLGVILLVLSAASVFQQSGSVTEAVSWSMYPLAIILVGGITRQATERRIRLRFLLGRRLGALSQSSSVHAHGLLYNA